MIAYVHGSIEVSEAMYRRRGFIAPRQIPFEVNRRLLCIPVKRLRMTILRSG